MIVYRVSESQALSTDSNHLINLRMEKTFTLSNDFIVETLAWEPIRGQFLLVGGSKLVLWEFKQGFVSRLSKSSASSDDKALISEQLNKLFGDQEYRIAATLQADSGDGERAITSLSFSPDGALFASAGQHDRLVKVWYHSTLTGFNFVYLPHARSVVDFEWRLPHTNQYDTF